MMASTMVSSAPIHAQRSSRKKSSLLSLRREKNKPLPPPPSPTSSRSQTDLNLNTPDFIAPTRASSSPSKRAYNYSDQWDLSRDHINPKLALSGGSGSQGGSYPERKEKERHRGQTSTSPPSDSQIAFPSFDHSGLDHLSDTYAPPSSKSSTVSRSRAATLGQSETCLDHPPHHDPYMHMPPSYRISDTSSTQTTPPQTPSDGVKSFRGGYMSIPVVVSAPVQGVETMDALVDGMNGLGGDDNKGNGRSSKHRRRARSPSDTPPPPLPTPPAGVVLGRHRTRTRKSSRSPISPPESDEDDVVPDTLPPPKKPSRKRTPRPSTAPVTPTSEDDRARVDTNRPPSSLNLTSPSSSTTLSSPPSIDEIIRRLGPTLTDHKKSKIPPIFETTGGGRLRSASQHSRSPRPQSSLASTYTCSTYASTSGHRDAIVTEAHEPKPEPEPQPLTTEEEADLISRSSVDTIAEEIQQTIRHQSESPITPRVAQLQHAKSFPNRRRSNISDGSGSINISIRTPLSDGGAGAGSIYSYSATETTTATGGGRPPSSVESLNLNLAAAMRPTQAQAIAQYLNSTRLNTILKLTRSPHASVDHPLTVSLSDLGSPNGYPVVVFMGLGCVRHIMGLYDDMAECLGLRLITIDRWGVGRTSRPRSKGARGIPEWASVVEEVLDLLHIEQCSVMAHSAGAPYALAFANRVPERIRGDICLLAPWVGGGEGAGYKWLKYVPNGLLKTAQVAEWKVQGWMIGKPPKAQYEGIGYDAKSASPSPDRERFAKLGDGRNKGIAFPATSVDDHRPSIGSNFSEYDDLADFDGQFESRSTLGAVQGSPTLSRRASEGPLGKRKPSKSLLGRKKDPLGSPSLNGEQRSVSGSGKTLKALKSMGSLKGKANSTPSTMSKKSLSPLPSPHFPVPLDFEVGLGLGDFSWNKSAESTATPREPPSPLTPINGRSQSRADRRRSMSFSASQSGRSSHSSPASILDPTADMSYQVALGNALMSASHAESLNGTHNDLLQILNHDHQPWGFAYAAYPHKVQVWYGDRDERIAESAVRWMERVMGPEKCTLKILPGADHGLMFKASVVIDVFEELKDCWLAGK